MLSVNNLSVYTVFSFPDVFHIPLRFVAKKQPGFEHLILHQYNFFF